MGKIKSNINKIEKLRKTKEKPKKGEETSTKIKI